MVNHAIPSGVPSGFVHVKFGSILYNSSAIYPKLICLSSTLVSNCFNSTSNIGEKFVIDVGCIFFLYFSDDVLYVISLVVVL